MLSKKNNIVIIFGAGAVENSWTPVLKAFKKVMDLDVDTDGANTLFASFIYLLRFYSKIPVEQARIHLKGQIENTNILKDAICDEVKYAQKQSILKPRKEFREILQKFVFNDFNNKICLISTNWDTVIDNDVEDFSKQIKIEKPKCIHIHGSVEYAKHMYLPSETTQENYRSDQENKNFGRNHFITMNILEHVNQIILYGISLDPLDAELCQNLNGMFARNVGLKEIIIINPECKKIKSRVSALIFPKRDIKIKCFKPENLNQEE